MDQLCYTLTGSDTIPKAGLYPKQGAIEFTDEQGWSLHDCWNGCETPLCSSFEDFTAAIVLSVVLSRMIPAMQLKLRSFFD